MNRSTLDVKTEVRKLAGTKPVQAAAGAGVLASEALRELPADFRTVVYLADVEGYTYHETATMMGTPIGTVMSRLHRARRALRSKLGSLPTAA